MKIKKRTADAHKMRRKTGLATTHAQYGYDKIAEPHAGNMVIRVVPNAKEQEVVKAIMAFNKAGLPNYAIAKHLNQMNIPAKKGGIWTGKTIKGVIDYQLEITKK